MRADNKVSVVIPNYNGKRFLAACLKALLSDAPEAEIEKAFRPNTKAVVGETIANPALVVLGANIWTTNDNALYTSGLGLSNITKIRKRPMVLVAGVVGTVTALWLYNNFVGWLNFLNATLPPVGALIALDFFRHRKDYAQGAEARRDFNWGSIIGVVAGALVGNYLPAGIASVNAMIAACICYLIAEMVGKK